MLVAADKFHVSIHNHLGCVRTTEAETIRIIGLTNRELMRGVGVSPSVVVPVINVFAEDNEVGTAHGLGAIEFFQQGVGGRAARAALGRK